MKQGTLDLSTLRQRACSDMAPRAIGEYLALVDAEYRTGHLSAEVHAELRYLAYTSLSRAANEKFDAARELVLKDLVPWCITPSRRASKADIHIHFCRDLLGKWINGLRAPDLRLVLRPVIDMLISYLHGRTYRTACWTLGNVGYRDPRLIDVLKELVATHPGKAGDHALALLYGLGRLSAEEEEHYIDEAILRFQRHRHDVKYYLLVKSASREVLEFIRTAVELSGQRSLNEQLRLLGVIASVVERLPDDPDAADIAVSLVRRIYNLNQKEVASRLAIAGNLLPAIDSRRIGEVFADLFLDLGPDASLHVHALYVQTLRMRECVGQHQLAGMPSCVSTPFIDILKRVLLIDGARTDSGGFLLKEAKQGVLWAAMALESSDSLKWLSMALEHEPDVFAQRDLIDTFACFRIEPLPEQIRHWVTDQFDAKRGENAGAWIVRTSALRIAQTAATQEAFDILLSPGLTISGTVLMDTVRALADVALAMTNDASRRIDIVGTLLQSIQQAVPGPGYSAAIHAILVLARYGRIPVECHECLLKYAFRGGQDGHDQARLIETLICAKVPMAESYLAQLNTWAMNRDDRVGEIALEYLIRIGRLEINDTIKYRFGLSRVDGIYRWAHQAEKTIQWAPYFIGLLFEKSTEEYQSAILDILESANWQQCAQIYGALKRTSQTSSFPEPVRQATLSRLSKNVASSHVELDLFSLASQVAPEAFLCCQWELSQDHWFVDARISFAESIRSCLKRDVGPPAWNAGVAHLIRLAEDSQYAVRRSAFRALGEIDAETLGMLVVTWARSERHEARVLAAEAAGWIGGSNVGNQPYGQIFTQMEVDPHMKVRDTFSESMKNRRQRRNEEGFIAKLRQLVDPSNSQMLAVWRYGWAVARLADDDAINNLQDMHGDIARAPNVRHYIGLILKAAEKQWDECRKKWPDPVLPLRGTSVEAGSGAIVVEQKQWEIEYVLWGEPAMEPTAHGQWGGSCRLKDPVDSRELLGKEGSLRTEDGRVGKGYVQQWSNFTDVVFCGSGEYPK